MADSVLQDKFDMEEYVQRRMLEISDPEERKLYKEVAEHMLQELCHQNRKSLQQLEERVFQETEQVQNGFSLTMGMTDQAHYDITDSFMFPIFPEDVPSQEVAVRDMLEALQTGADYRLYTVYLQADYPTAREFGLSDRHYYGMVKTEKGEYRATFRVEKNTDYKEKLMKLYHSFVGSNVPWSPVCTAFLYKRFTVFICSVENQTLINEITEITVDFEEYTPMVCYHMIPLWNLEPVEEKSSTYPVPCEDKINYEHRIYAHRLELNCPYLVAGGTAEVSHVYRDKGDLVIVTPMPVPHKWKLYKFNQGAKEGKYGYPLLSNRRKESFVDNLTRMFHKQMRTRAGIAAIIGGFSYDSQLIYKGMELCPRPVQERTYDMDDFLTAEIAVGGSRDGLCLYFQAAEPENYLNYDIMSFLVTQIQAAIPDYYCFGQLI